MFGLTRHASTFSIASVTGNGGGAIGVTAVSAVEWLDVDDVDDDDDDAAAATEIGVVATIGIDACRTGASLGVSLDCCGSGTPLSSGPLPDDDIAGDAAEMTLSDDATRPPLDVSANVSWPGAPYSPGFGNVSVRERSSPSTVENALSEPGFTSTARQQGQKKTTSKQNERNDDFSSGRQTIDGIDAGENM
jgi:hypothetical protein